MGFLTPPPSLIGLNTPYSVRGNDSSNTTDKFVLERIDNLLKKIFQEQHLELLNSQATFILSSRDITIYISNEEKTIGLTTAHLPSHQSIVQDIFAHLPQNINFLTITCHSI